MMAIIVIGIILAVVGWVPYFTANAVYRVLVKKGHPYARLIEVLIFIGMFVLLLLLLWLFVANNFTFER